jgi:hypothetical protein
MDRFGRFSSLTIIMLAITLAFTDHDDNDDDDLLDCGEHDVVDDYLYDLEYVLHRTYEWFYMLILVHFLVVRFIVLNVIFTKFLNTIFHFTSSSCYW